LLGETEENKEIPHAVQLGYPRVQARGYSDLEPVPKFGLIQILQL